MKFKYLIIAFSIIIIFILLITVLFPSLTAGPEFAVNFRNIILPLLLFIFFVLVLLGTYLLLNYRLFSLLEREDWPALAYYLEHKIFIKGRYSAQNVRLLASSYMVVSDYTSVLKLEGKAMIAKPAVVEKNALIFGSARLLESNYKEAAVFFKTYLGKDEWIRWFYGFSLLLGGFFSQTEQEFLSLVSSRDVLIAGLSAYFLHNNLAKYSLKPVECGAAAEEGRNRVVKALKNAAGWKKEVEKMRAEIHVAVIRRYIDEAGKWIFAVDNQQPRSKGHVVLRHLYSRFNAFFKRRKNTSESL